MKRNSLLICLFAVLFLSSCGGRSKTASALANGDTIPLRYAENLTLMSYPGYTLATLRNPWDTLHTLHTYILVPKDRELPAHLPAGTVVRTPLSKSVIYSSVHCGLMDNLGVFGSIGGVCDLKYIKLPAVHEACRRGAIADCGDGMNPDMERIIDLHPDAILLSPFENSGGYGRIEKLDIPIIECADYMETSALGRAEWMRFYGLLFGVAPQADNLFAEVDSCYQRLKMRAQLSSTSFSVVSELKSGSAWYVPGGRSTIGRLFQDACGRYAFADDTHSGSVPLAFETVFDKAGDADDALCHARNFAPLYDIDEEAATGTSNGALTYYGYLNGFVKDGDDCKIIQGEKMGRPSLILTHLDADCSADGCEGGTASACQIQVGGSAVILAEGEIHL